MPDDIALTSTENLPDRPFTDISYTQSDRDRLILMAHQLIDTYGDPQVCDFSKRNGAVCESDPQGRHFRIYYIQPEKLFSMKNLTVVGFFGHKRPNADIRPLLNADKRFEQIFPEFEGLLSLSTRRLPDGDFANLVLFTDDESKDAWNHHPVHYETVSKISPPYYEFVRLNNGVLPDGLDDPDAMRLTRVRYLDYAEDPPWRAVRNLAD